MMGLARIKYKSFKFPNNPETTSMKCDRSYIKHKYPELAGNELEDFGVNACIISGSGVFFGKDAYENAKKLYNEYKKKGVGTVKHPIYSWVTRGLMTNLELTNEPEVNTIHYTFEIIADTKPNVKENIRKYAVKEVKKKSSSKKKKKSYKVGDIVNFHGGTHYVSSYKGAKGYKARAGKAKITLGPNCKGNGKAHPWHLIHTNSKSNVYGWVNEGTFD